MFSYKRLCSTFNKKKFKLEFFLYITFYKKILFTFKLLLKFYRTYTIFIKSKKYIFLLCIKSFILCFRFIIYYKRVLNYRKNTLSSICKVYINYINFFDKVYIKFILLLSVANSRLSLLSKLFCIGFSTHLKLLYNLYRVGAFYYKKVKHKLKNVIFYTFQWVTVLYQLLYSLNSYFLSQSIKIITVVLNNLSINYNRYHNKYNSIISFYKSRDLKLINKKKKKSINL